MPTVTTETTVAVDPRSVVAAAADMFAAFRPAHIEPKGIGLELTVAQVHALFLVAREGPMSMGQIAERLGVSMASATGIVARIHRHGLLTRFHRTDDRRVVECAITDPGRLLLDEMQGRRSDVATRALAVLNGQELAEFHRLIRLILERTNR